MRLLFLGSGGSLGVPVIGCICSVCQSTDTRNQRTRPSALLKIGKKQLLIDTGPDYREQALRFHVDDLDGLLLTHTHYDHVAGLDELRIYYFKTKKPVPCLLSRETFEELKIRYHYFIGPFEDPEHAAKLDFQILEEDFGETLFQDIPIQYLSYTQASMKVTGFRLEKFAYVTDIQIYDERVKEALKGVETLVLSAPRMTTSPVHFGIQDAIDFKEHVGAKKLYITHISHETDHEKVTQALPKDVDLSYDGLEIDLE